MGHAPVPVFFVNPAVAKVTEFSAGEAGNFAVPMYNQLIIQVWGGGGGGGGGGGFNNNSPTANPGVAGSGGGNSAISTTGVSMIGNGGGGGGGGAGGAGGCIISDRRLKTDIKYIQTTQLGLKLYSFRYRKNLSKKYIGVMAQDVLKTPWKSAVHKMDDGHYCVDYAALGGAMIYVPEVH